MRKEVARALLTRRPTEMFPASRGRFRQTRHRPAPHPAIGEAAGVVDLWRELGGPRRAGMIPLLPLECRPMSHDLFQASALNDTATIASLLDAQPEWVHSRQEDTQRTCLHEAVSHGSLAAAELLLQRGADPNAQAQCGEAPLHLTSDREMTRLLLTHGAKPSLADNGGITPMDWALIENDSDLFLILAQGAPELGSPHYQLLKVSRDRKLLVEGTYDDHFRVFRVIQLGWTLRTERCFAYQETGTTDHPQPGLRCFVVDKFSHLYLGDPYSAAESEPESDREHPPCVATIDETPFSQNAPNKTAPTPPRYQRN